MDVSSSASFDYESLTHRSMWLRKELFDMAIPKKKGHVPSSYSTAEILITLFYGGFLKHNPQNPADPNRDRLIISKGHGAMAVYPILAECGFFSRSELGNLTRKEGIVRQYADNSIPGVECVTGSLGHGIGFATGFGIAAKNDGRPSRSYVIMSDGECYEGSVTEAARITAQQGLDNVVGIIDRNGMCILGQTEKLVRLEPLEQHWESLVWYTQRINGHSYSALFNAFANTLTKNDGRPSMIVADTVKGKGISPMENNINYHNKFPTPELTPQFRAYLDQPL